MKIETKFLPATNTKGERITAKSSDGTRVVTGYKYDGDSLTNHRRVAERVAGAPVERKGDTNRGFLWEAK